MTVSAGTTSRYYDFFCSKDTDWSRHILAGRKTISMRGFFTMDAISFIRTVKKNKEKLANPSCVEGFFWVTNYATPLCTVHRSC